VSDEGSTAATWVDDAWRSTRDEIALFLRTLRDFVRAPHALMRAWAAGEARPMNPLGYLGMCFLVVAPAELLLSWRTQAHLDETTQKLHLTTHVMDLLRAGGPYIVVLAGSVLSHGFLRLLGNKGRLSRTLGALLYVEGPDVLVTWLTLPHRYFYGQLGVTSEHASRGDYVSIGLSVVTFFYFAVQALSGVHGVRRWKVVLAIVAATLTSVVLLSVASLAWLKLNGALPKHA
jgi:xanthine/uracil permease